MVVRQRLSYSKQTQLLMNDRHVEREVMNFAEFSVCGGTWSRSSH